MFKRPVFNNTLLNWYQANKRQLPWRQTSDPFKMAQRSYAAADSSYYCYTLL